MVGRRLSITSTACICNWGLTYFLPVTAGSFNRSPSPKRAHSEQHLHRVSRSEIHAPTGRRGNPERGAPRSARKVQVPFWFLDRAKLLDKLDLFDEGALVWRAATGETPAPACPPYDPLTSWVALAYVGGIERGGPCLEPGLDREARLDLAREVLSDEELLVVETIAVPHRYRCMPAPELEAMVRRADSYLDRLWAACWLILIGWTASRHCSFRDVSSEHPLGEIDEAVRCAYAREHRVAGDADLLGQARIGRMPEANLIHRRLAICQTHYGLNGPPPYDCVRQTIPEGSGWKRVVRLVPDG